MRHDREKGTGTGWRGEGVGRVGIEAEGKDRGTAGNGEEVGTLGKGGED